MLELLESNKENLINLLTSYTCENDIYGILLKTGKYINAKDIIYQNLILPF